MCVVVVNRYDCACARLNMCACACAHVCVYIRARACVYAGVRMRACLRARAFV